MLRGMDVVLSFLLVLLALPLGGLIVIIIWIDDRGAPFYRQRRIGRDLQPFMILKFRTMRENADQIGSWRTEDGDPRITRVGRWLRRTSLDELPQLVNVLAGDMSLVGPRPFVPAQLEDMPTEIARRRHAVRPGVTGPAQIGGRSHLAEEEAMTLDLAYADAPQLATYLLILLRTPFAVLSMKGTN